MNAALIVFARQPLAGVTKTRLIPALGAEGAARLYAQLLARTLNEARTVPGVTRYLSVDEVAAQSFFEARLPHGEWRTAVQTGATLGARMAHALAAALRHHPQAVLIGSDILDFTAAQIGTALRALEGGNDAVLAPAADGGYWLVGLSRPLPALFEGIAWGSAEVYSQSIARLRTAGVRWQALATCHDIDTPEDLADFAGELAALSAGTAALAGEFRAELLDATRLSAL